MISQLKQQRKGKKIGITYLVDKNQKGENEKLQVIKTAAELEQKIKGAKFEIFTKHQKNIGKKLDLLFGQKDCDFVIMIGENEIESGTYMLRDKNAKVSSVTQEELISILNTT